MMSYDKQIITGTVIFVIGGVVGLYTKAAHFFVF